MTTDAQKTVSPDCVVVRGTDTYVGKQGPTYRAGVSAERAGSTGIWMGVIEIAPGARTKAHFHANHETALYVQTGDVEMWSGADLENYQLVHAGDYVYIPAGVSHVAANRSDTEPVIVIASRTDPNEQESVVLQPDLDAKAIPPGNRNDS